MPDLSGQSSEGAQGERREVSAEGEPKMPEPFVCSADYGGTTLYMLHCETKILDCALTRRGVSCVKKGGIFKLKGTPSTFPLRVRSGEKQLDFPFL